MTMATTTSAPNIHGTKGWNIALWLAQGLLALLFGMAGVMKTTQPIAELAQTLPWAGDVPAGLVRFIGAAELAGALGMILPTATRIAPRLTPLAAIGLALVMVLAAAFHLTRSEASALPINLALGGLALFVAWGRFKKVPIAAR
jgi:putative oxidoreductase